MESKLTSPTNTGYCVICEKRVCASDVQLNRFPSNQEQKVQWVKVSQAHSVVGDAW